MNICPSRLGRPDVRIAYYGGCVNIGLVCLVILFVEGQTNLRIDCSSTTLLEFTLWTNT